MTYVYMGIATVVIVASLVVVGNLIWSGCPPTDSDQESEPTDA